MTVITLTTDFGLRDGFVGILKGVISGHAAQKLGPKVVTEWMCS